MQNKTISTAKGLHFSVPLSSPGSFEILGTLQTSLTENINFTCSVATVKGIVTSWFVFVGDHLICVSDIYACNHAAEKIKMFLNFLILVIHLIIGDNDFHRSDAVKSKRDTFTYDSNSFLINGKAQYIFSGSIHYPRSSRIPFCFCGTTLIAWNPPRDC